MRRGGLLAFAAVTLAAAVLATLGYLFLGSSVGGCLDALDSDDSGTATISDAILALNYLFTGGDAPPPPFPEPGPDPTEDAIRC